MGACCLPVFHQFGSIPVIQKFFIMWCSSGILQQLLRQNNSIKIEKLKIVSKYLMLQVDGKIGFQLLMLNSINQSEAHSSQEKLGRRRYKRSL